jgi:3-hydroxyacyl-CoA dehydrogenase
VAEARAGLRPGLSHAPATIIDCVEQITPDLAAGLAYEAGAFAALLVSEASCALRHAFFGERQVARIPGLPRDLPLRSIETVGVIGGGTMGTGIAIALLNAGLSVTMVELRMMRWPARATPSARRWPAMSTRAASPPMRPTPA